RVTIGAHEHDVGDLEPLEGEGHGEEMVGIGRAEADPRRAPGQRGTRRYSSSITSRRRAPPKRARTRVARRSDTTPIPSARPHQMPAGPAPRRKPRNALVGSPTTQKPTSVRIIGT